MSDAPPASLVSLCAKHEQSHILAGWSTLSSDERNALARQVESIDFALLHKSLELSLKAEASLQSAEIRSVLTPVEQVAVIEGRSPQDITSWRDQGMDLIRRGKCAVILLAGGQGTRLGSSAPKGCYDIGLPSHKSLFQLHAERILAAQRLAGPAAPPIPWYIMTSAPTDADTRAFFAQHAFFGLPPDQVFFFQQGVLPAVSPDGKVILSSIAEVAMAPDGNGGVYRALDQSGALADMETRGIECVDCVSVDNALVRPCDPVFMGYCHSRGAEVGARVCVRRGPEEKVGVFVQPEGNTGGLAVREYSELGQEEASAVVRDAASGREELRFRWANLCMQYLSVGFLRRVAEDAAAKGSTYHVAWKSIPSVHGPVRGIKLEQFIFDPFPTASALALFEIERCEEFAPVKNAPGSKDDSPDTARALLMALHEKWATQAGAICAGPIEIPASVSHSGEGLEGLKGKTLESGLLCLD